MSSIRSATSISYVDDAAEHGLQIRHVFLTHFHADFLAGHLELRDRTGATIHLGARRRPSTRSRRWPTATASSSAACA